MVKRLLLALVLCGAAAACSDDCLRNSDCMGGLVCGAEGRCVTPPDGAVVDAGADGEALDAAESDGP